ncbi:MULTISPECIES: MFS transporter [Streptomyces]|uniref:Major facilitator superfamily MFS_1 transporter n=1 Tax=Streptomyces venezuelae (strain ATCC 10712 / CBS 650.69 / DSM 40230 / JCM 4526 / NBRC 13096 / PD 04745) TaxID=953739 RepID=F2RDK5_STRVP|nr:MFS transporter [Streptomyces venezuelae]APE24963.1 MFS transporter [Streptomyces venezuelae]QES02308.1 MFS transporter [Streptomyces venezuelae ATCC 10712]CCA59497.1 major facilitator superfamily MFS_1 transporter [Streptomyces venezuelae ATCC 10712]
MSAPDEKGPKVLPALRAAPLAARYLLGGALLNQMGAFLQTFLVLYLVHKGLGASLAGIALGAYSLGAVVGTLAGGELTHRLGARTTIAASMAGSALLVSCVPLLSRPGQGPVLIAVTALTGAITQAYRPAASTMLSDLMPDEHRVMAFSMFRIAINVGAALGPLIAFWLITVDWDLLFWFDGATALLYALLALAVLPRRTRSTAGPRPAADAPEDPGAGASRSVYGGMVRDIRFVLYLAAMALMAIVYVQYTVALPLELDAAGLTSTYSIALTLSSTVLITCELAVTARVKGWPAHRVAAAGTVLMTLGMAGYGLASGSTVVVLLCTVVFVSGLMTNGPTMFAYPATAPLRVKGRYIGTSQAVFGLGSALGTVLGEAVWRHYGGGVWLMCAAAGVGSAVCCHLGMRGLGPAAGEAEPAAALAPAGGPRSADEDPRVDG